LHEGASFIRDVCNGRIRDPSTGEQMPVDGRLCLCLSHVYLNKVKAPLEHFILGALRDRNVCKLYGLDPALPFSKLWMFLTPEASSGMTVLMEQLLILPRMVLQADLAGNMKDDGRRNVGYTRMRIFTSTHQCGECFTQETLSPPWRMHWQALRDGSVTEDVFTRHCKDTEVQDWGLPAFGASSQHLSDKQTFLLMAQQFGDICNIIAEERERRSTHLVPLDDTMLHVSDGLVNIAEHLLPFFHRGCVRAQ